MIVTDAKNCIPSHGLSSIININKTLRFKKSALAHCMSMINCDSCNIQSPSIMLVLSVCEKMIVKFEQTINTYASVFCPKPIYSSSNSMRSSWWPSDPGPGFETSMDSGIDTSMSDLKLDVEDEALVVKVLVFARMKSLSHLLEKLQGVARMNGWENHAGILKRMDSRLRVMAAGFRGMGDSVDIVADIGYQNSDW
jgi:hypothetical protein